MTLKQANLTPDGVEQLLFEFWEGAEYYDDYREFIKICEPKLTKLLLEQRMQELGAVQSHYGHHKALTHVDGEWVSIEDRFKALKSQLNKLTKEGDT